MSELWAAVPGYEGWYEVSTMGRVRSMDRTVHSALRSPQTFKGRILKQIKSKRHYATVGLHICGERVTQAVHRLVLITFVGDPPAKDFECCHYNGDWYDNRLENLRWATNKDNHADAMRHGTLPKGEQHVKSKLTEADVRKIREMNSSGVSGCELARLFGIAQAQASRIIRRALWKHIP